MLSSSRSSLRDIRWPKHRFRGCLFVKRQQTKDTSFALNSRYASTSTKPSSSSDKDLCEFFDHPPSRQTFSPGHSGLFTHRGLTSPSSLQVLAEGTLKRAQNLTNRIVAASNSRNELFTVVKNLDKLSDMLCGVIDMAELVRNSHPDYEWVRSANDAYEKLCEFMNVLNTHVGLYKVLQMVLSDEEVMRSLSREAYYTAMVFWKDFEKSAINLPESQRKEFVSLSTEILVLGRQFLHDASSPRPPASISSAEIRDLKDKGLGTRLHLQARFTNRDLMVYPGSLQAQMIMRSAPAESPRRKLYVAANSSTSAQIDTLEQLLKARAKLAKLVGKESFAHMALDDKMAKSPENVRHFLNTSMDHTRPYARSALLTLSQRKQTHLNLPTLPIIEAWDRDYYCPPEPPAPPISLPTLTPGTVFKALSRLFEHLYGVTLRPADTSIGEVWHSDVRKLEVVDEDAGIIGWIYADLFARPGKASGAAHYTVRCSRRTDDDGPELLASSAHDESVQFSQEFDSLFQRRAYGQDGLYQLPVVVLLCEFTSPSISGGPSALQWHEVQTLFHEMGHAMHSMIGRTEYHNVAGTRCATDFVELPSILMEHFLNSPSVLSLFDHSEQAASRVGNHHEDPCHSIDTHSQILLASLDQEYHSAQVMNSSFSSTATLAYLQDTRGLIPSVPGTSWQTQFGHLFGYGATYYSYLFDRAIASRVWSRVFSADPLNRDNGEKFKNVLRYGGGMDPWTMVSSLLSTPELERGDEEAMREVGRWRIEDEVAMPGRH